jgi:hypothetical protein
VSFWTEIILISKEDLYVEFSIAYYVGNDCFLTLLDVPLKKQALYAVILIAAKLTLIHFGVQAVQILP